MTQMPFASQYKCTRTYLKLMWAHPFWGSLTCWIFQDQISTAACEFIETYTDASVSSRVHCVLTDAGMCVILQRLEGNDWSRYTQILFSLVLSPHVKISDCGTYNDCRWLKRMWFCNLPILGCMPAYNNNSFSFQLVMSMKGH